LLARLPGVALAALTVSDERTARVLAVRTVPLEGTLRQSIATHQKARFEEAGVHVPPTERWAWQEEDSGGTTKRGEEIRTALLHSAPPVVVACSLVSDAVAGNQEILTVVAQHFSLACKLRDYKRAARNLARILLEPGETSYNYLRQHSQAVSELAQRIAASVGLSEEDEELVTLAAYLHDVGMRELEYQRTYRMERPGEMEKRMFQRHPVVGARIVESAAFPGDLPGAIRHHHERWDGNGYPNKLAGRAIPVTSRIIHLAEVWDVLTSPSSYKRNLGRDAALDIIRGEAGRQFDPDLVPVLEQLVRT
jgi:putative nucleotidyltransferase with HDIG domain